MSDLRVMTVPPNQIGLRQGMWLHWDELRNWLVKHDNADIAEAIEQHLREGEDVDSREIKVRT